MGVVADAVRAARCAACSDRERWKPPDWQERERAAQDRLLSESWATLGTMTVDSRAALEALCGPLLRDPVADQAADRAVQVLQAQAAALNWVRQATGTYPAPLEVARRLAAAASQLRGDDRDPVTVLIGVAAVAVAEHQATTAA